MKLQILGTGCPKCIKLAENAQTAIEQLGVDCELVKVTDINDIMSFGIMMTPGLALDGEVKYSGRIATVNEIKELLLLTLKTA